MIPRRWGGEISPKYTKISWNKQQFHRSKTKGYLNFKTVRIRPGETTVPIPEATPAPIRPSNSRLKPCFGTKAAPPHKIFDRIQIIQDIFKADVSPFRMDQDATWDPINPAGQKLETIKGHPRKFVGEQLRWSLATSVKGFRTPIANPHRKN